MEERGLLSALVLCCSGTRCTVLSEGLLTLLGRTKKHEQFVVFPNGFARSSLSGLERLYASQAHRSRSNLSYACSACSFALADLLTK
jgi:hypothetical protein